MGRPSVDAHTRFARQYIPEPNCGCWLWTGYVDKRTGYARFMLGNSRDSMEVEGAHRASWRLHRGEIPDGMIVCHKCDERSCVNPDHLFLGTYVDNQQDASRKGRLKWKGPRPGLRRGEQHPGAKLSADDVREIRASGESMYALARRFGVSDVNIHRIRTRKIWRSVA